MITKLYLTAIITFALIGAGHAQEPEIPEFKNEPMLVNNDGSLKKLEQVHYESVDALGGGIPFMDNSLVDYVTFETPKSPVRADRDTRFIIKLKDTDVDPESLFFLTKVVSSGKQRLVYTKGGSPYDTYKLRVKIDFKVIAPGVYLIMPTDLKAKSEYAFVFMNYSGNKARCFLFGID